MITRVQVKNFRSLADVDVELSPLTVLVGRNGTGKSSFIDALRFVRDAFQQGLENAIINRHGIASIRRWSPRRPYDIEIALTVEEVKFWGEYSFVIASGKKGTFRVKRELCLWGEKPFEVRGSLEVRDGKLISFPPDNPVDLNSFRGREVVEPTGLVFPLLSSFILDLVRLRRIIQGHFYSIFPNTMREPQKPSNEEILLDDGSNFASVLRRLEKNKKLIADLIAALGRVVEGVSDLRVVEVGGYLVTELNHEDENENWSSNSPWFELYQESDGTLRMLGMLIALYQTQQRQTLLAIEEPENALHPGALAVLGDVLREATTRHQVLITTQSPDLISRFNADELRIVERIGGITKIGRIDETQRQVIEENLFSAGDLLRIEGLRREPVETTR